MIDPAYDLQKIYEASGTSSGTTVKTGKIPTSPDEVVTFLDTGGRPEQNLLNTSEQGWKYPTVQVRVRGDVQDYIGARELSEDVYNTLHKTMRTSGNSNHYEQIIASGEPIWLGYDDNNRPEWSINFEIMK